MGEPEWERAENFLLDLEPGELRVAYEKWLDLDAADICTDLTEEAEGTAWFALDVLQREFETCQNAAFVRWPDGEKLFLLGGYALGLMDPFDGYSDLAFLDALGVIAALGWTTPEVTYEEEASQALKSEGAEARGCSAGAPVDVVPT